MKVTRTSLFTGKTHTREIDVSEEQMAEINLPRHSRRYIQDIVPHLSPEDREFLMSGVTPEEWVERFGTED